jgi:hypothetical protein
MGEYLSLTSTVIDPQHSQGNNTGIVHFCRILKLKETAECSDYFLLFLEFWESHIMLFA